MRRGRSTVATRSRKRKLLAAGATLALGFGSTIVFAEWLATGTGEGYAKAVEAQALTTESATATGTLYPGGTGDLTLRVRNPNPFPVTVTSVAPNGPVASDAPACDAAGHGVSLSPQQVSLTVSAEQAETFTLPDAITMAADAADECQGATFTIPVSLNGGTATDPEDPVDPPVLDCDDGRADTLDRVVTDPETGEDSCEHVQLVPHFPDADGDGFGAVDSISTIMAPADQSIDGYVQNDLDCDDSNANVNPASAEIPGNGIDDNCDLVIT